MFGTVAVNASSRTDAIDRLILTGRSLPSHGMRFRVEDDSIEIQRFRRREQQF
jgi:hypothetical protein